MITKFFRHFNGKKAIFWAGSDITQMLAKPDRIRVMKLFPETQHFTDTKPEGDELKSIGLNVTVAPSFLEDVNDRVVDLMEPFASGLFVDKDFFGSASIKNVLPIIVPSLSYKELGIQEGASAQRLWMDSVLRNKSINKDKLFHNLIEYCKMDTLAMVEIWRVLVGL